MQPGRGGGGLPDGREAYPEEVDDIDETPARGCSGTASLSVLLMSETLQQKEFHHLKATLVQTLSPGHHFPVGVDTGMSAGKPVQGTQVALTKYQCNRPLGEQVE